MRPIGIILLITAAAANGADYTIDPAHSAASFGVRHMMVSTVRGHFSKVTGKFSYDPKNLSASAVEAAVDVTTIDTREPKRDAHLKSPDFFDVKTHKTASFKSTKVEKDGAKYKEIGRAHV